MSKPKLKSPARMKSEALVLGRPAGDRQSEELSSSALKRKREDGLSDLSWVRKR